MESKGYMSKMEQKERMKIETVKEINRKIEELFSKPITHIFEGEYHDSERKRNAEVD